MDRPLVLHLCYTCIAFLMCLSDLIPSLIARLIACIIARLMASLDIFQSFLNNSLVLILFIFTLQQTLTKPKYIKTIMRY
jgi:hypothetical protein